MTKFFGAFFLLMLAFPASGETDFPAARSSYVNDYARLLPAAEEAALAERLEAYRAQTGVEFVVVSVARVGDYGWSGDVPGFATALFNHWGLGDAKRNDGVLFLVSRDDRYMFIALGDGYPAAYDGRMDAVFDQVIRPRFQAGAYAGGIAEGVDATIARLSPGWVPTEVEGEAFDWLYVAIVGGFVVFGGAVVAGSYGVFRRCPDCGRRGVSRTVKRTREPLPKLPGSQEVTLTCRHCRGSHVSTGIVYYGSGSSGSGGGSFGGGSSSGGGGGGGW